MTPTWFRRTLHRTVQSLGADRNASLLAGESALAAAAGVSSAFGGIYILRLGASNALIGLMSALPALVAMLLYVPAGLFLQRRRRLVPWVVGPQLVFRVLYFSLGLAPFLFPQHLIQATAVIMMLTTLPQILSNVGNRAAVITWRVTLGNGTGALLVFLAGRWLDSYGRFPANYQLLFVVCFFVGLVHTWSIGQLKAPDQAAPAPPRPRRRGGRRPRFQGWRCSARIRCLPAYWSTG
jgi:hypothetical protein